MTHQNCAFFRCAFFRLLRCQISSILVLIWVLTGTVFSTVASAQVEINFFKNPGVQSMTFKRLGQEVSGRTSIELLPKPQGFESLSQRLLSEPWLWIKGVDGLVDKSGGMTPTLIRWLKRGGFILIESSGNDDPVWDRFAAPLARGSFRSLGWSTVPQDHELMRSFYLLPTLPSCNGQLWRWFGIDGRLAMLQVPYHFSAFLQDQPHKAPCDNLSQSETQVRVFVNLMMVALTTDYKRDQIHLPEILKRLRSP